jgi:hypothetical protein
LTRLITLLSAEPNPKEVVTESDKAHRSVIGKYEPAAAVKLKRKMRWGPDTMGCSQLSRGKVNSWIFHVLLAQIK